MLSDTDAACVAFALALRLEKRRRTEAGPKRGIEKDHNTHMKIS